MIYLLIPSFNDSKNFALLFKNIDKSLAGVRYRVVMVDDGSTDNTRAEIKNLSKKYPITVIGYSHNRGPGFAFSFGFNYIIPKLNMRDFVVTMEADNSTDFNILRKMLLLGLKFDIVLSSPFAEGGKFIGLGKNRLVLSIISNYLDSLIFRIKNVRTYSSFYRVYSAPLLKKAYKIYGEKMITEDGFSAVVELLIKLSKLNPKIQEVGARLDWRVRRGKSKMKVLKTILNHLSIYKNYFTGQYF